MRQYHYEESEPEKGRNQPNPTSSPPSNLLHVTLNGSNNKPTNGNSKVSSSVAQRLELLKPDFYGSYPKETEEVENKSPLKESVAFNMADRLKQTGVSKARIRTSFDPDCELPKLHKWYLENPHPTRQQVISLNKKILLNIKSKKHYTDLFNIQGPCWFLMGSSVIKF